MALGKLWQIAWRDLGRNRRRSFFTLMAVALGLALLIFINGLIAGVMHDAVENNIRLRTGHVQLRAPSYEEGKLGLAWGDLLPRGEELAAAAHALPQVASAAPVIWAAGILNTPDDTTNLQVYGIDVTSDFYAPVRDGLVAGEFLAADDRNGLLLGQRLAESMGLAPGSKVSLAVLDADGQPVEQVYTVRGLFRSGAVSYDENSVFLPLAKAQAVTNTGDRASAVTILLHDEADAEAVAASLAASLGGSVGGAAGAADIQALTWRELNQLFLQTMEVGLRFYLVLDLIVMLVVAVVIANTLLMAVFERVREMGILAALGMKGRQIMGMFLLEAAALGLLGILVGAALGTAIVLFMSTNGIYMGEDVAGSVENIAIGATMYTRLVPQTIANLSVATLVIILLASLYPAWFAARLEPVQALHSL
jgi:ABC-type lipoprotein release transport system permease subunit